MSENQHEELDTQEELDYVPDTDSGSDDTSEVLEAQARSMGWKPEAEFRGDSSKWTDAKTFLEVHERNNGALRKANERLVAEVAEIKRNYEGLNKAQKQIYDYQLKKEQEAYDNQIAFLKAQRRAALGEGQHELAAELEDQIDAARERGPDLKNLPAAEESKPTTQETDWRENPKLVAFVDRNPWVETNDDLAAVVVARAKKIKEKNPGIALEDLLDQAVDATKQSFPEKFGATSRRAPVESTTPGATNGASTRAKSYQSMPKEAQAACDEFVNDRVMTQEQYVKMYFEAENQRKAR